MLEKNKNRQYMTVKNQPRETEKAFQFLIQYIQQHNISSHVQDDLRLALEETLVNIISYAYPDKKTQEIKIEFSHNRDSLSMTFIDTGKAFNPLTDTEQFDENDEHFDGGMGIHLIRSLTDTQDYKRTNQTNVFTLTKHYTN